MSISSSDTDSIGLGKVQLTSKAVQEERLIGDVHPETSERLSITDLPDDCLSLVYKSLESNTDYSSFGLVCRHWLQIQNNNHESLWDTRNKSCLRGRINRQISPENFSKILCKLLIRFKHLKRLSLSGLPEVTDYITSQSQLFGSKVRFLCLKHYIGCKLSLIFSSFPRLTSVCLSNSYITDKGLEVLVKCCPSLQKVKLRFCHCFTDIGLEILAKSCASLEKVYLGDCQQISNKGLEDLAKCCASLRKVDLGSCYKITDKGLKLLAKSCPSLKKVDLSDCQGITDSGISFIIQNCSKIRSLNISYCRNVTGIGFLGCPKTLTIVDARGMSELTAAGIKAIASGGGIETLYLSGNAVNNEALKSLECCPLLETLWLESCPNVQLAGWKAIGFYCKNLKNLNVVNCQNICDKGLTALCYGCNKLSYLFVNGSWSYFALELFKRERPDVQLVR